MGVRDYLRQKAEEFRKPSHVSVAERLAELKKERVKEEGRTRLYRLEKQERNKLAKAKLERQQLVNEKRFAGVKKLQEGLQKIKKGAEKFKSDDKNNPWR
jgi:hypothetical protein